MGRGRNKSAKKWRAKVARVAKNVAVKNQETKYYEWTGVNNSVGGSGAIIPLFSNSGSSSGATIPFSDLPLDNIDQGTAKNQRLGTQITLKGLHLRMRLEQDPNNTFYTQVRVILGWLDPNFGSVSLANIFNLPTLPGNNVVQAFIKGPTHENTVFRKVLVDRLINLPVQNTAFGATTAVQSLISRVVKVNVPFHNKKYQFISGTAGINGEHEDLWLFVTAYSPGQGSTVQVANMGINGRVYYKDG